MSDDRLLIEFHPTVLDVVLKEIARIGPKISDTSPKWEDIVTKVRRLSVEGKSPLVAIEKPSEAGLGIEPGGLSALLTMLDELGRNTTRAFLRLNETGRLDEQISYLVQPGLLMAEEQGVDPTLKFGLQFNSETGEGELWTEQPMLVGCHGLFNPSNAVISRRKESSSRPPDAGGGSEGGLASIESGILFTRLENNGYVKDGLSVSILDNGEQKRLRVGFTFRKLEGGRSD